MTRERVEPGIWRRGEVFEITWRDAQGKQRRKTGQGGCQAEVVDQERPVGTRMLQRSSRISRPSALARSTTRFRRRWDSRNLPWRQLALDRRSPSRISSVRPSSADIPAESDPAPGPEAEALDLDGFLGGHLGPALDLRVVLRMEQHLEVRQDGADLVADRFGGRSGERPFPRSEEPAFPTFLRIARATAASSSHSLTLLKNSIRTVISTSGYVCPLNGSRSTKALGRRSRLLRDGLPQEAGLAGAPPPEDETRSSAERDPEGSMSRFDEPLHPFAHGLRQRVLELVDPLGLEIDIPIGRNRTARSGRADRTIPRARGSILTCQVTCGLRAGTTDRGRGRAARPLGQGRRAAVGPRW
jgi:hypothetical protein